MEQKAQSVHSSFFQTYIFPALYIFLIPVLSLIFLGISQKKINDSFYESAEKNINQDAKINAEQKKAFLKFFKEHSLSSILASNDPQLEPIRKDIDDDTKWYCLSLHIGLTIAWWSIGLSLAVVLICPWPLWLSIKYPEINYYVIVTEWNILKVFCFLQVLGQAYLIIALSFWITATFMEVYFVKLILLAVLLAAVPVFLLIQAIFSSSGGPFRVFGKVLEKEQAPRFWARLEQLAENVGTRMPDRVVLGLEDTFFVTEGELECLDGKFRGKTLFLSLPMLRVVSRSQADAIFAHELAHFSGGDTVYSKKIAPLLNSYEKHLQLLYQNPGSFFIFYYMHSFWSFFHWSLGVYSKKREYRADKIAADNTSPQDIAIGLLLVGAYSGFRTKMEVEQFNQDKVHEALNFSERIRAGYWEYVRQFQDQLDADTVKVAHPFDTHPTFHERTQALGIAQSPRFGADFSELAPEQSWIPEIRVADEWESELWEQYQQQFRQNHEASLVYRYLPETEEERLFVEQQFPVLTYTNKKGQQLVIDLTNVYFPDKDKTIEYSEIESLSAEEEYITRHIYVHYAHGKVGHEKFVISGFDEKYWQISKKLGEYITRYKVAADYVVKKKAQPAESSTPPAAEEPANPPSE